MDRPDDSNLQPATQESFMDRAEKTQSAATPNDRAEGNGRKGSLPSTTGPKRPSGWAVSTFSPALESDATLSSRDVKGKGRATPKGGDRTPSACPPSFVDASSSSSRKRSLPAVSLAGTEETPDRDAPDDTTKKPRLSVASALRPPLPLAPAADLPDIRPHPPTSKPRYSLLVAPSFTPKSKPSKSARTPPTSAKRSVAPLSTVLPPIQTPTRTTVKHEPKGLLRGLLEITGEGKERLKVEDEDSKEGVKLDGGQGDPLLGVSPKKRNVFKNKGSLSTSASLLLTSHQTLQARFYASLLSSPSLPPPDIELEVFSLLPNFTSAPPSPNNLPLQKAGPLVRLCPLQCRQPNTDATVSVLLRLDRHSTSLPPSISRWSKLAKGVRIQGWRPFFEVEVDGQRVLGLERFVVVP